MQETVLRPIDYLAVEWPGTHVTGEEFRPLMDLLDQLCDPRAWGGLIDTEFQVQNARLRAPDRFSSQRSVTRRHPEREPGRLGRNVISGGAR